MAHAATTGIADVWRDQRQWSNAASRLKKRIIAWRSIALGLAIVGAVLATLAAQLGLDTAAGRVASIVSAVMLAIVPVIRATRLGRGSIETWTRARSASEGLKTEVYLYLTGTPPYDGADRDAQLLARCDAITSDVDDVAGHTIGVPDADKPLPPVTDVESYVTSRVLPQLDGYYRPGAAKQQRRLTLFRGVEYALGVLGALLGAVAAVTGADSLAVWVAVVTTVAAAITAHIAAARYEHLVISYLATARQLRVLVRRWRGGDDHGPAAAARLVRDCEDVISRENESWMAAWSRDEEGAPSG